MSLDSASLLAGTSSNGSCKLLHPRDGSTHHGLAGGDQVSSGATSTAGRLSWGAVGIVRSGGTVGKVGRDGSEGWGAVGIVRSCGTVGDVGRDGSQGWGAVGIVRSGWTTEDFGGCSGQSEGVMSVVICGCLNGE